MPESAGSFTLEMTLGDNAFAASGKPELVLSAFEEFKALTKQGTTGAVPPQPPSTRRSSGRRSSGGSKGASNKSDGGALPSSDKLPLPAFLAGLTLAGNRETATAVLAWCTDYAGADQLTLDEISRLWARTHYRKPSNLARDLASAEKKGWLETDEQDGKKVYVVNGFGKKTVGEWAKPADKEK